MQSTSTLVRLVVLYSKLRGVLTNFSGWVATSDVERSRWTGQRLRCKLEARSGTLRVGYGFC